MWNAVVKKSNLSHGRAISDPKKWASGAKIIHGNFWATLYDAYLASHPIILSSQTEGLDDECNVCRHATRGAPIMYWGNEKESNEQGVQAMVKEHRI